MGWQGRLGLAVVIRHLFRAHQGGEFFSGQESDAFEVTQGWNADLRRGLRWITLDYCFLVIQMFGALLGFREGVLLGELRQI
jgi:hypothetical protein